MRLAISDAHTGLQAAIASVYVGAAWQRCRVHFVRNVLTVVPKGNSETVAAAIRAFAQPDAEHVHEQLEVIAVTLGKQVPKVEQILRDAHDDSSHSPDSRCRTGRMSGRPTRWSDSTRK